MSRFILFIVLIWPFAIYASTSAKEQAIKEIRQLVSNFHHANREGDIDYIMSFFPDTVHLVDGGQSFQMSNQKIHKKRQLDVANTVVKILELTEPVVSASDDGSMAWAISNYVTYKHEAGNENNIIGDRKVISSLFVFSKFNNHWKISAVADTLSKETKSINGVVTNKLQK